MDHLEIFFKKQAQQITQNFQKAKKIKKCSLKARL